MIIPNGNHFCCLALNGPRLKVKQEQTVLPGLVISHEQNTFELEPHWVEWLGTIHANSFRESTLFITAIWTRWRLIREMYPFHSHSTIA